MKKETINSEAFLKSSLEKNPGFTTPKDYFSKLDECLQAKLLEDTLPKETGFTVQNNYFTKIENKILNSVSKEKGKVISLKRVNTWAAAAVLVFAFCAGSLYFINDTKAISFENIAQSDIEYWIENHTETYTSFELERIFEHEKLRDTTFDFTEISDNAIEEYLLNEDIIDIYDEMLFKNMI